MLSTPFLPFLILATSIFSFWLTKNRWYHGVLLGMATSLALASHVISYWALLFIATLAMLWLVYLKHRERFLNTILFLALVIYGMALKLHFMPGFFNWQMDRKFYLSFDSIMTGFFPMLLVVPVAKNIKEWKPVFTKGLFISVIGIGMMAVLAVLSGTISLTFKLPSHPMLRYLDNLLFVAVIEEAFFRGFIQQKLGEYFKKIPLGNILALFATALIFTSVHWFWAPNLGIFIFVFLASLLYGYVYLATKRIESAILCHFLLNFIHMTFFTYHAM